MQQIYISENEWKAILGSKLSIISKIRSIAEQSKDANELRENLLADYSKIESPTETAIAIIKQEVRKLI